MASRPVTRGKTVPHDHNRDYPSPESIDFQPIYQETAALATLLQQRFDDRFIAAFDLHCPWVRYENSERLYLVGSPVDSVWQLQQVFGQLLEQCHQKQPQALPYFAADTVPYGTAWNTNANYQQGVSCGCHIAQSRPDVLSATVEVPYSEVRGAASKSGQVTSVR